MTFVLAASTLVVAAPGAQALPPPGQVLLRDTVVNNTDPNLRNTELFGDGETSVAVNPVDPNEIVVTGFSGCWSNCGTTNAPLFHSLDGGQTWTKRFTIPPPPGLAAAGCPCDQTFDFDRQGNLFGSFLIGGGNIVSGSTDDPADASRWRWNGSPAQVTDISGTSQPDQNWLIVNRNPTNAAVDNVYVAYDDFATNPVNTRVSVSSNAAPPNFTVDNDAGDASVSSGTNPGLRMAGDPSTGRVYVMYQQGNQTGITWRLNRSTDGGATWGLNGDPNGIVVGSGPSRQGNNSAMKFGSVNALIGGVDHLAVDPRNGDVLVVFGTAATPATASGNNLFVRRITNNPDTTVTPQAPTQITPTENAALPSIAVTSDGTVGVFYYTFDGNDGSGFPTFSTHFARSVNGGAFTTLLLQSFTSPVKDNGDSRQRIFGDYNQTKAFGQFFYGVYTGGGEQFGHPNTVNSTAELDPIFFSVSSGGTIVCPANLVPTIVGTPGPDDITGTPGPDVIFGLGGNDRINGLGGDDVICGGDGDDLIYGGDGNDTIFGDAGNDRIFGGNGNDLLFAGPGAVDQVSGGDGDDGIDVTDGVGGDQAVGGNHVNGDTCVGDPGDSLASCNP